MPALSVNKDRGVDAYSEFVHQKYMDVPKSDELDKAYKEILNEYLGVDIYHKGDWTYEEISTAIKTISLITSLIPLNRVLLQKVKIS